MIALVIFVFIAAYVAIAFEHGTKINKTAPALIGGVCSWTIYILFSQDKETVSRQLAENLGEFSGILFFLMGAMTIVEIIDAHDGFHIITQKITQTNKRKVLWIVSGITFFMSPVLDNLTTAIVMVSLLQKVVSDTKDKLYFVAMIVIAANAGGAWSPIGDVTTTMLWLGGQITAFNIIRVLLLPSIVSLIIPLLLISRHLRGNISRDYAAAPKHGLAITSREQLVILCSGLMILIFVPIFKAVTQLPPYMGILIGLGVMWVITEKIGSNQEGQERYYLSPAYALRKIDSPSILFFLGILLSIAVLERVGLLAMLSHTMDDKIGNEYVIVSVMGLLSSIIDNVPLMAAAQGMYSLADHPPDSMLWEFLAYCTGTGGSILIIGSAAGVAVMGIANVNFVWYLKNVSWPALAGYLAGAICYIGMR